MATPLSYTPSTSITVQNKNYNNKNNSRVIRLTSHLSPLPSPPASDTSIETESTSGTVQTTHGAPPSPVVASMPLPLLTEADDNGGPFAKDDTTPAVAGISFGRSAAPSASANISPPVFVEKMDKISSFDIDSFPQPPTDTISLVSNHSTEDITTSSMIAASVVTHGISAFRPASTTLAATLAVAEGTHLSATRSDTRSPITTEQIKSRHPLSLLRKIAQRQDGNSAYTHRSSTDNRSDTSDHSPNPTHHHRQIQQQQQQQSSLPSTPSQQQQQQQQRPSTPTVNPMQPIRLGLRHWMNMVPSMGKMVKTVGRHIYYGPPQPSWSITNHLTIVNLQDMMAKLPSEIAADPVQLQRMRYAWEHYAKDAMPGYRRGRRVMNSIELPKHPIHELNGFGFEHIYLQSSLMTDTTRHDTSGDKTWMPNLLSRSTTRKHMPNGVPQYSPAAYAAGGGACKPGIKVFNSSQSKGHIQVRSAIIPADYCVRATQHVQSLGLVPSEKDIAAAAAYSPTSTLDSGSTSSPPSIHGHGYASNSSTSTLTAEWITWHPTVDKKDLAAAKSPSNSPSATAPREQQQQQQQLSMQQLQQMYGQSPRDLMGRSSRRSSYQRSRPNSAYSLDSQFSRADRPQSRYSTTPRVRSPLSGAASTTASTAPSIPASLLSPHEPKPAVILYLHGGGYFAGSALTHRVLTSRLAQDTGAAVFALNYRLAPEHPFPAALQDALAAYFYLTQTFLTEAMDHENGNSDAGSISAHRDDMQGISPDRILIAGDSAGGGLTVALLLALRDLRLPLPAGAITLSPWLDQTSSSTSATANSTTDYLPNPDIIGKVDKPWWQTNINVEHFYVRQRSLLTCPYVSPLWATDLSGLPPILMQVGGAERFKDEVMQFAQHAVLLPQARPNSSGNSLRLGRTASIVRMPTSVRLEVYEEMPHVWACFPNMPATRVSQARAAKFIHSCLTASPQLYPEYLQIAPDGELLQHSLLPLDTIHQTR